LDALRLAAVEADAMVSEANKAFLMNILIFEERDVAAGRINKVHSLEEISDLVKLSPLKFQNAYAGGDAPSSKCPFLVSTASDSRKPSPALCPWPFVWLHAPRVAMTEHPGKNALGAVGLCSLVYVAAKHPKTAAAVLGAFSPLCFAVARSTKHYSHNMPR